MELTNDDTNWLETGSDVVEQICSDDEPFINNTYIDWNIDSENKIAETKEKVEIGVTYVFPLETKVTVKFNCLPKNVALRKNLKIQQVKVADLKLPDSINPATEYAYDITTGMKDGSFKYEITLPKPENQEAKVSYIEKSVDEIKEQNVKEEEIKSPEKSKITQETDQVIVTDLDHFTIYFVESGYVTIKVEPVSYLQGETVYLMADGLTSSKHYRFYLDPPGGGGEFAIGSCQSGSATTITESYTLSPSASTGNWKVKLYQYNASNCTGQKQDAGQKDFAVNQPKADLVVTKTNDVGGITKVGQPFKWTLKVVNQGTARAEFGKNETILIDNLPDSGVTYGSPIVENVTNISQVGGINCSISAAKDLTCKTGTANGNYVYIEVGGYFEVSISVTPSVSKFLENPRGGHGGDKCQVDPDGPNGKVNESNENNNICSDSVFVTLADGNCNICASYGKPGWLVLRLETASGMVKVKAGDGPSDPVIFNQSVNLGSTFTISGNKTDGTFSKNDLFFYKDDTLVGKIHVSCSKDIISGQTTDETHGNVNGIVDFTVIQAHNQTNNLTCPVITTGTLIFTKYTNPSTDTTKFTIDIKKLTDHSTVDSCTLGNAESCTKSLAPGDYYFSENLSAEWRNDYDGYFSCTKNNIDLDYANNNYFSISSGDTVSCTVTNTKVGHLIIQKTTIPSSNPQVFDVRVNGNGFIYSGSNAGTISDNTDFDVSLIGGPFHADEFYNGQSGVAPGWIQTSNDCTNIMVAPGETKNCTIINTQNGSISGYKYEDVNGDGQRNNGEDNLLAGWIIKLKQDDTEIDSETTDANGTYSFSNVVPGDYQVCEILSEGWIVTDPTEGNCKNVTVEPGKDTKVNFGNFELGKIQGRKYEDLNNDSTRDSGEPYLNNWTIRLYKKNGPVWNLAGSFNTGDTGTVGQYRFEGLTLGQYKVCEVLKDGWKQTAPTGTTNHQQSDEAPRCRTTSIAQSGQIRSSLTFGNFHLGKIQGQKFNDLDGDGVKDVNEPGIRDWVIGLDKDVDGVVDYTSTTSEDGTYTFQELTYGTYRVREQEKTGWVQTTPNPNDISIQSGSEITGVNFGNFELGKVTVTKFHDRDQDGTKDSDEEALGRWIVNLASDSGTLTKETALPSGQITFDGLLAGNYVLTENQQDGWKQTNIYCEEYEGSYQDSSYSLNISSGTDLNCYIGNYQQTVTNVSKANNIYPLATTPGSVVTFTLKLKVHNNNLYNTVIKDILPPEFTFNNVWSASVNGTPVSLPNPNYASPGTWQVGDLNEGDEVIINYQAKVKDGAQPGLYKDLAWTVGNETDDESSTKVLALATNSGADDTGVVSENFVGTKIAVNKDTQSYTSANIEKEETKEEQGEVLGASTGLPATGGKIIWIIIAALFTLLGSLLIFMGLFAKKLNLKKIAGFFLALFFFGMMTQNVLAGSLSVRLSEPKSPTRFDTFDLNFVALDLENNPITVDCYYKKDGGVYAHFDTTKSLAAGGNVGSCRVTSSQIDEDGKTYSFYVTASNGTETINSETVSVDFNTQGPGTPTNYSKEKPDPCHYKISFRTADDSGKTAKVEVYRSDKTDFNLDSGTRVASLNLGSSTDGSFTDLVAECNKTYYYAVRAFDIYGNGSGWIGDSEVKITTTTTTTATTTASETAPTTGALPVTNVTLPSAEVLGEKTTTPGGELTPTSKPVKEEVINNILGAAAKKENRNLIIAVGIGLLTLVIIGYAIFKIYKKKKPQT